MVTALRMQRDAARRERTRAALLDAARVVMARQGYHQTLVSDIARQAGTGQGTFYRSFRNKRQLLEVLFDEFVRSLLAEFSDMTRHMPMDLGEYVASSRAAVSRGAAIVQANRDLVLLFLRAGPSIDREFEERLRQMADLFAALARSYLDHAISRGFARPCDSDLVSQAIVGLGIWHIDRFLSGRGRQARLEDVIEELVDFAFWGFVPRDAGGGDVAPGGAHRAPGEASGS